MDLRLEPIARLGAGASSTVHLARVAAPWRCRASGELLREGTEVAVKRLRAELREDPRALAALAAEAEHGARVHHPSLVRVLEASLEAIPARDGEEMAGPFLVLSYVPGPTLAEHLEHTGPMPEPAVRRVGAELAEALGALHAAGLAHGDLKPENVRLDAEGRAVLLDLGLACAIAPGGEGMEGGGAGGSLLYLSPERARGGGPTPEADVYALGAVLFELATGAHPLDPRADAAAAEGPWPLALGAAGRAPLSTSSAALMRRAIDERGADAFLARLATARIPTPSSLAPELSPFLDAALLAALARGPERRLQAASLARALAEGERSLFWRNRLDPRAAAAAPPSLNDLELPMVGREAELNQLTALFQQVARKGTGAVAWLDGGEGSGKWRLARELVARARRAEEPPIHLYTRWYETAEARPAGALLSLLRRWLQLAPERSLGPRERERLAGLVAPEDALVLEAALAPEPDERLAGSVGRALAAWLIALSAERPVIVFIDQLHRAAPMTLGALGDLVRELPRMRALLILGTQPEPAGGHPPTLASLRAMISGLASTGEPVPVARIPLQALRDQDVAELVRRLFHRAVPRMRLAEVLWQRSRGNPGLIAEILHDLAAAGSIAPTREGGLSLAIAPDELPMPRSLSTLIAERLRNVPPEQRLWLQRLAVVGGRIEPQLLGAAFAPATHEEIDTLLVNLVATGWLVPAGERFRFARPALREAVYRTMPSRRRVRMHAAAARGLAQLEDPGAPHPSPEAMFQRAFHLRAAEEHEQALSLVLALVRRIRGRAAAQRLLVLARWGLEALDRLPEREARDVERLYLLEVAADAADRLGAREEERELLDRLVDLDVDPEEDPASAARLYLLHGRYAVGTGQLGLARGFLRNARELALKAPRDPDGMLASETARRLGAVQAQIGEAGEARGLAEQALAATRVPHQRALAHLNLALVDALEDRFEDGLQHVASALRALRNQRVPVLAILGFANLMRARLLRSCGRPGRAIGAARRAVRLAERAGERRFEAEARARLGALLLHLGHTEEAEAQLRDALLRAREIEDRRGQVIAETWLGILLWEADDASAHGVVERAARAAEEIGFYRAEAVARAILARIHRDAGQFSIAARAADRAAELVHQYGAELADRIVVLGTHALVLFSAGRDGEARSLVRELRRTLRRHTQRVRSETLRKDLRTYSTQLLELVLSVDGPVYPRAG